MALHITIPEVVFESFLDITIAAFINLLTRHYDVSITNIIDVARFTFCRTMPVQVETTVSRSNISNMYKKNSPDYHGSILFT